jgi:hypothetical protein
MTHEDWLANVNALESHIKDFMSKTTDKDALRLSRTALKQIPVARRGIEALAHIEKILEGIIAWQMHNSMSK